MSRTATAVSPVRDDEATVTRVDQLIQRGRGQGHLSLPELRTAFEKAGISAADGRSILRELSEAGVRLGNEAAAKAPRAAAPAGRDGPAPGPDADMEAEAEATIIAEAEAAMASSPALEADLDDHTPAMGDSVHTYLKSIGRTSLLTAEQEVDLAKRIEAGLFAEHKLDSATNLDENFRRELELVAEDGRRAKSHMLEANLRLVVSVAKKYSDR